MPLLDTLIQQLGAAAASARIVDVRVGPYYTAVAVQRPQGLTAGLAGTLGGGEHQHGPNTEPEPGTMLQATASSLMELVHAPSVIPAAVGMATINALLDVDEEACVEINAGNLILERGRGKRVVIVGHFPFVPQVRSVAAELAVLELNPRQGDLPADQASQVIPTADVVAITGTTLLNHTFDALMALCPPQAYVLVLGGTTPLTPLFFDLGVDVVAGTVVGDVQGTLLAVSQGGGFRQIPGKRLLTLQRDPSAHQ